MNKRQKELYTNLITLCDSSDMFYFADHVKDDITYRIFNYRIASYTEFLLPDALECRGHTFRLKDNGEVDAMVSWTLEKFFNIGECPYTIGLDLSEPEFVIEKLDGSLISTYVHKDKVHLKSKGSLTSDQANAAMDVLYNSHKHRFLKEGVLMLAMRGFTVIMEYTAPDNRIVLGYAEQKLTILAVRNNETGEYIDWSDLNGEYSMYFKDFISLDHTEEFRNSMDTFVEDVKDMKGIEGYIIRLKSGQRIKFKTVEYFSLHKTKDNINSPRKLFECVINEASDDLRSLFADDEMAIKLIDDMEVFVHDKMAELIHSVDTYYNENKGLDRKDYAILGQKTLDKSVFGLVMKKYTGHDVDFNEFMIKQWKYYGLLNDK